MNKFIVHTKATAPAKSDALLTTAESAFGFIPNLLGVLAESPAALEGYLSLGRILDGSSLSATERQIIILAVSRYNECRYCVAAHSVVATVQHVPDDVIAAIRNDEPIADPRLEALRQFSTAVVQKRGWVSQADLANFIGAGYTRAQVLEVILGVAFKTISNYTNHVAGTPLDDTFAAHAWRGPDQRSSSARL